MVNFGMQMREKPESKGDLPTTYVRKAAPAYAGTASNHLSTIEADIDREPALSRQFLVTAKSPFCPPWLQVPWKC